MLRNTLFLIILTIEFVVFCYAGIRSIKKGNILPEITKGIVFCLFGLAALLNVIIILIRVPLPYSDLQLKILKFIVFILSMTQISLMILPISLNWNRASKKDEGNMGLTFFFAFCLLIYVILYDSPFYYIDDPDILFLMDTEVAIYLIGLDLVSLIVGLYAIIKIGKHITEYQVRTIINTIIVLILFSVGNFMLVLTRTQIIPLSYSSFTSLLFLICPFLLVDADYKTINQLLTIDDTKVEKNNLKLIELITKTGSIEQKIQKAMDQQKIWKFFKKQIKHSSIMKNENHFNNINGYIEYTETETEFYKRLTNELFQKNFFSMIWMIKFKDKDDSGLTFVNNLDDGINDNENDNENNNENINDNDNNGIGAIEESRDLARIENKRNFHLQENIGLKERIKKKFHTNDYFEQNYARLEALEYDNSFKSFYQILIQDELKIFSKNLRNLLKEPSIRNEEMKPLSFYSKDKKTLQNLRYFQKQSKISIISKDNTNNNDDNHLNNEDNSFPFNAIPHADNPKMKLYRVLFPIIFQDKTRGYFGMYYINDKLYENEFLLDIQDMVNSLTVIFYYMKLNNNYNKIIISKQKSDEKIGALFKNSSNPMLIMDLQGIIRHYNRAAREKFDLIDEKTGLIKHPYYVDFWKNNLPRHYQANQTLIPEIMGKKQHEFNLFLPMEKIKNEAVYKIEITPIRDKFNEIYEYLITFNVTRIKIEPEDIY